MKEAFKCTFSGCCKVYVNSAILKRHTQAFHSTVNKFQCKLCGKSLASRQNLKEHSYIHSGEKPYTCKEPGCKMSFRQGTHLSAHKKLHLSGDWVISLQALTRELSCLSYFSDEPSVKTQVIVLPVFKSNTVFSVLPSLF